MTFVGSGMSNRRQLLFRGGSFSRSVGSNQPSSRTTSGDNIGNESELVSLHVSGTPAASSSTPAAAAVTTTPDACAVSGGSARSCDPYTPYTPYNANSRARHQPSPPPYTPYNEHGRPSEGTWSIGSKLSFDGSGPQQFSSPTAARLHRMLGALMQYVVRIAALVWAWFTWAFPPCAARDGARPLDTPVPPTSPPPPPAGPR